MAVRVFDRADGRAADMPEKRLRADTVVQDAPQRLALRRLHRLLLDLGRSTVFEAREAPPVRMMLCVGEELPQDGRDVSAPPR